MKSITALAALSALSGPFGGFWGNPLSNPIRSPYPTYRKGDPRPRLKRHIKRRGKFSMHGSRMRSAFPVA